jgi:hypothetical protein
MYYMTATKEEKIAHIMSHPGSWTDVAKSFEDGDTLVPESIRKYWSKNSTVEQKEAFKQARLREEGGMHTTRENQDGVAERVFDGQAFTAMKDKSEEDLLRSVGVDPEKFYVTKSYTTNYNNGDKFSIRVEYAPKIAGFDINEYLDKIKAAPIQKPVFTREARGGINAVLPLYDLHFGMPGVNYDKLAYEIEQYLTLESVHELVIVLGGDVLHVDNSHGTTTAGTKVGEFGTQMVTDATLFLMNLIAVASENVDKLRLISVAGNHDLATTQVMLATIKATTGYEFEGGATVETYGFNLGNVPMVAYHGGGQAKNRIKASDYLKYTHKIHREVAMQSLEMDAPIHWFTGHIHSEKTYVDGVKIHQVPSVAVRSDYEVSNGWVDSDNHTPILLFTEDRELGHYYL